MDGDRAEARITTRNTGVAQHDTIRCYHRAPSLWKVFQINQFESDLRSVGMAMVRGGIDLYVVMIAWEAASLII